MTESCTFCEIIARKLPGHVISEDEQTIVFLSLENHPLVIPKKHLPDIFALDNETGARIMNEAIRISKAMRTGLPCDGIYVTQSNGSCAGQDVFHYHLHLYPKWNGRDSRHLREKKEILVGKIKSAL